MSDVGKYLAIEAEVTALVRGTVPISGVLSVSQTFSMRDLSRDTIRKPAVGIIVLPTQYKAPRAVNHREMWVRTKIAIPVAIVMARNAIAARPILYRIFEELHDRVHYAASALPPGGRYIFDSEVSEEQPDKGLLLGQAVYQLDLLMGQ